MYKLNNKGFSLLEVLVGVSIIGIISAIAVPTYQSYRQSAALTTADSTIANIAKAYKLCQATSGTCTDLVNLKLTCDNCLPPTNDFNATPSVNGFCVALEQRISSAINFKACVQITPDDTVVKTYAGNFKFCRGTVKTGKTYNGVTAGNKAELKPLKICEEVADCPTLPAATLETPVCEATGATAVCASGKCS